MTYLELAHQLAEINKKMMKLPEYTKMTDANRGEGVLLGYLRHHDGEATPAELSVALDVSTARIAVLLNKMERKKLVERQKHPHNNKNTIVRLLPEGRKLSEEQEKIFKDRTVSFFETLGEDKAALFVELQGEMVDFMMKNPIGENSNE